MPKNKEGHGIVLDDKGQEQPKDKDRAQTAAKTEPGHMPPQPAKEVNYSRCERRAASRLHSPQYQLGSSLVAPMTR